MLIAVSLAVLVPVPESAARSPSVEAVDIEQSIYNGRGKPFDQQVTAGLILGPVMIVLAVLWLLLLRSRSWTRRLAAVPRQSVAFEEPGSFVLHLEAPRLSTAFAGVRFTISRAGVEVPSRPILLRSHSSGWRRVKLSVRRFAVGQAGEHQLEIQGVAEGTDISDLAVLFSRGYLGRAALALLMIFAGIAIAILPILMTL